MSTHTPTAPRPFTVGQAVTVMSPDTWLHLRAGTVVVLPTHNGINLLAVRVDGDTPLGPDPVRWFDPRRVAPAHTCADCETGCYCEGGIDGVGCAHYGCWGRAATNECPVGADAARARSAASKFAREALHGHHSRETLSGGYRPREVLFGHYR